MNCPACQTPLSPVLCDGQSVDICQQCRGVWFDPGELSPIVTALAKRAETPGLHAKEALNVKPPRPRPIEQDKICPRCNIPTSIFNYSYDPNVFLNRCPICEGIWADGGEVQQLARYTKGNPAVRALAKDLSTFYRHKKSRIHKLLSSRLLSGGVAATYLTIAATVNGETVFRTLQFLLFPLVAIWFSDAIGGYTGMLSFPRPPITKKSPGILIALMGWVLLLLPIMIGLIGAIKMK